MYFSRRQWKCNKKIISQVEKKMMGVHFGFAIKMPILDFYYNFRLLASRVSIVCKVVLLVWLSRIISAQMLGTIACSKILQLLTA